MDNNLIEEQGAAPLAFVCVSLIVSVFSAVFANHTRPRYFPASQE